jgi:ubiquitin C-terminal hydrolase
MDFQMTIDITDFVIQKDNQRNVYNLYGVITHLGKSGPDAHFVATCKSPVNGKWYRYNDAIVDQANDFYQDIYNFGTPYILFYEKES